MLLKEIKEALLELESSVASSLAIRYCRFWLSSDFRLLI